MGKSYYYSHFSNEKTNKAQRARTTGSRSHSSQVKYLRNKVVPMKVWAPSLWHDPASRQSMAPSHTLCCQAKLLPELYSFHLLFLLSSMPWMSVIPCSTQITVTLQSLPSTHLLLESISENFGHLWALSFLSTLCGVYGPHQTVGCLRSCFI